MFQVESGVTAHLRMYFNVLINIFALQNIRKRYLTFQCLKQYDGSYLRKRTLQGHCYQVVCIWQKTHSFCFCFFRGVLGVGGSYRLLSGCGIFKNLPYFTTKSNYRRAVFVGGLKFKIFPLPKTMLPRTRESFHSGIQKFGRYPPPKK